MTRRSTASLLGRSDTLKTPALASPTLTALRPNNVFRTRTFCCQIQAPEQNICFEAQTNVLWTRTRTKHWDDAPNKTSEPNEAQASHAKQHMFFEKSMIPQKHLRLFWGSFRVLNERQRSNFVFFRNYHSTTKNVPNAQTAPGNTVFSNNRWYLRKIMDSGDHF